MNENVSALVQTASTIEKPAALQDLKPSILGDSLKRLTKKDEEQKEGEFFFIFFDFLNVVN
jgi:hypothetical protein